MAFEIPKSPWDQGKSILTWAILWAAYIDLILIGAYLIVRA